MIKIDFDLPEDFSLYEEEHLLYLHYKGEEIASFSTIGVNPEIIKYVAECYLLTEKKNEGGNYD